MKNKPLSLTSPKQRQGGYFEQQALDYLQEQGLRLIAQNWCQPKIGEIDLVMLEQGQAWDTVVFVEVRHRGKLGYGDALASVTTSKQRKIIKTAKYFLQQHPQYQQHECRFDVVAYTGTLKNTNHNASIEAAVTEVAVDKSIDWVPDWITGAFVAQAW